ncbi:MAG TPA: SGNH/GDSL hydrolase family protein [Thermoguttaceae bacterium]|nr:SGNH/GDSL hydrolase family protein [Thermoguttaceae bacterium]
MFRWSVCTLVGVLWWQLGAAGPVPSAVFAQERAGTGPFSRDTLRPFWLSATMHGESLLFVQDDPGGRPRASLLFQPTRILSLSSSSGEVTYQEGRDYLWKPGTKEIVLPPGSAVSFQRPQDLRRPAKSQRYALTHRDGNGEILFGGGHEYHDMQATVTYEHEPDAWAGPRPSFAGDRLPRTIGKLRDKRPLAIVLLGDSISTGCNASGWAKVAPFQPPYQDLLVLNLQAVYGGQVTLTNLAVGGTDTAWGLANIDKVIRGRPDLVILAFGMNDAAGRPAPKYQANVRAMIEKVSEARPETEFLLVATMLGNRDWTTLQQPLFPQYRDALAALCRPGVALADMTSLWTELLKHKQDRDLTGNGVNHPNDFGHRLYAQVLSALLIPPSPEKQAD